MEQKDNEIIRHLRSGKRVNISAIARELRIPVSTVADRIRKIDERYVMKRASLLDYPKLGYTSNQMMAIKIEPKLKSSLLDFLKNENCVNAIYCINSDFSFLVEVVCRNHFEFINWLENAKSRFPFQADMFHILKVEEKEKFV